MPPARLIVRRKKYPLNPLSVFAPLGKPLGVVDQIKITARASPTPSCSNHTRISARGSGRCVTRYLTGRRQPDAPALRCSSSIIVITFFIFKYFSSGSSEVSCWTSDQSYGDGISTCAKVRTAWEKAETRKQESTFFIFDFFLT